MENSYENTTGDTFGSYLLYELGNGAGHAFRRRGSGDGDSTDFHSHSCSADERSSAVQPDFNSNPAINHHRSTNADHDQGCRREYSEHASVTQRSRFSLASARNAGEQSTGKFVYSDGSVSAFRGNVNIRRQWESSQRKPGFDDSGSEQFQQSEFHQSQFNDSNGSESNESESVGIDRQPRKRARDFG